MNDLKSIAVQQSTNPSSPTFSLPLFTSGSNNIFSNKKVLIQSIELLDWSYSTAAGARLPVEYINVFMQRTPSQAINDMRNVSIGAGGAVINSPQLKFVDGDSICIPVRQVNLIFSTNQIVNQLSVNVKVATPVGTEFFFCQFRLNWLELDEASPDGRAWERIKKKISL